MPKTWQEFGSDTSLYWRLHDAVRLMLRSGKPWKDRAQYAFECLGPIDARDLPLECQATFETFRALDRSTYRDGPVQVYRAIYEMTPAERDQMVDALLLLYSAAERARAGAREPSKSATAC